MRNDREQKVDLVKVDQDAPRIVIGSDQILGTFPPPVFVTNNIDGSYDLENFLWRAQHYRQLDRQNWDYSRDEISFYTSEHRTVLKGSFPTEQAPNVVGQITEIEVQRIYQVNGQQYYADLGYFNVILSDPDAPIGVSQKVFEAKDIQMPLQDYIAAVALNTTVNPAYDPIAAKQIIEDHVFTGDEVILTPQ